MNAKRYIAQLLLAVYLLATGGMAFVSLSCRCVTIMGRSEAHVCCAGCSHDHEILAEEEWTAPCCDDRHSTEIALYTGTHPDEEKGTRCAVTLLPPSLAAECPCPAHVPALRRRPVERPAPVPTAPQLEFAGLRAPPVLV